MTNNKTRQNPEWKLTGIFLLKTVYSRTHNGIFNIFDPEILVDGLVENTVVVNVVVVKTERADFI